MVDSIEYIIVVSVGPVGGSVRYVGVAFVCGELCASLLYAGPVDSLRAVIVDRDCRQVVCWFVALRSPLTSSVCAKSLFSC